MSGTTAPAETPVAPAETSAAPAEGPVAPAAAEEKAKVKGKSSGKAKPKSTFMLHDADTMCSIGKYQSTDYRYAALKAASKGANKILLRKTNSKEVRQFTGSIITLDTPKQISRGDRVIKYTKRPTVKFEKKFTFAGDVEDEAENEEPSETPPATTEQTEKL